MPKKAKVNLFFADHSYQIFEDEDILKEIFQYLPTLKAVNRVSKKFYKVATEMRKGKDWFWIRNEDDIDDKASFRSIIKTQRVINNFAIGESSQINPIDWYDESDDFLNEKWYFDAVKTVVGIKNGENVKRLQLMNVDIAMSNLITLLNFTPNLKLLKLFFVNKNDVSKNMMLPKLDEEPLPAIPDVIMYECGSSINILIKRLPENSIKSLTIKTRHWEILATALQQQKSIVKMNLMSEDEAQLPSNLLDGLKLTHLTLDVKNTKGLKEIIAKQSHLIMLDTSGMIMGNDILEKISI